VQGLPAHTFQTDEGDVALKCPTEIAITDRREKEFSDLGFIPLVHCKNTDYAAFFAAQSAQKSKKYDTDFANANARLSTQLPTSSRSPDSPTTSRRSCGTRSGASPRGRTSSSS